MEGGQGIFVVCLFEGKVGEWIFVGRLSRVDILLCISGQDVNILGICW